jgi:hypothetical protein
MRTTVLLAIGLWLVVHNGVARAEAPATYDCSWIAPAAVNACQPRDGVVAELARVAALHATGYDPPPDEAAWREMLAAVTHARTTLEPGRLSMHERITAQNAALHIAQTAAITLARHGSTGWYVSTGRYSSTTLQAVLRESSRMVAWLALGRDQLQNSDADGELVHWLGPRPMWIEEQVDNGGGWLDRILNGSRALFHENIYSYTRAFRMVHVGDRHFIFSQLIAIDTAWRPHVTPVIGEIEMRIGTDDGHRACIAKFEPALAHCGLPAGLRVLDRLPIRHRHIFVDANGRAFCHACHRTGGRVVGGAIIDLMPKDVDSYLTHRRNLLLARLKQNLALIRRAAADSPH